MCVNIIYICICKNTTLPGNYRLVKNTIMDFQKCFFIIICFYFIHKMNNLIKLKHNIFFVTMRNNIILVLVFYDISLKWSN